MHYIHKSGDEAVGLAGESGETVIRTTDKSSSMHCIAKSTFKRMHFLYGSWRSGLPVISVSDEPGVRSLRNMLCMARMATLRGV